MKKKPTFFLAVILLLLAVALLWLRPANDSRSAQQLNQREVADSPENTVTSVVVTEARSEVTENSKPASAQTALPEVGDRAEVVDRQAVAEKPAITDPRALRPFGKGAPFVITDLPDGILKTQLLALNAEPQAKALNWLHSFTFNGVDAIESMRVDKIGGIFFVCAGSNGEACADPSHHSHSSSTSGLPLAAGESAEDTVSPPPPTTQSAAGDVAISAPPIYNSKPGSTNHIYLDFNGAAVSGKSWTEVQGADTWTSWNCEAWDFYASNNGSYDPTTFSLTEQAEMKKIWERIAEDYAPFDVNITTDASYDPVNYTGDKNKVGWLLFTPTVDKNGRNCPHYGSGGVAYLGVYGESDYFATHQPAWVTSSSSSTTTTSPANMAEAASHEMGHNMGLSHDGTTAPATYYSGHNGVTNIAPSWGPIMGSAYGRDVTQWSKGEYYQSAYYDNPNLYANTQDDLAVISSKIPYRTDDHGDSFAGATIWTNSAVDQDGIVERTSNIDYFKFATGAGTLSFNATTYKCDTNPWGGNVDIILELYDASYNLISSTSNSGDSNYSSPAAVNASISKSVAAGTYYLVIKPSGTGTPLVSSPSGYTVYGSVGQYNITGTYFAADYLFISSPVGGENWVKSTTKEITWLSGIGGNVKIELIKGGVASTIIASTPNDGSYHWTVPKDQTVGIDYKIKITSLEPSAKFDQSTSNFTISAPSNNLLIANMDTNPGFTTSGTFEYGIPSGTNKVLTSHSGSATNNIYDTTLNDTCFGDGVLKTPVIDCSNHKSVKLEFWAHAFMNSNYTFNFEVSNDNSTWTQLFSQTASSTNAWVKYSYDISAVADGQSTVYVRWSMIGSGSQSTGGGLAIDDVSITGNFIPADDIYLVSPDGGETLTREIFNQVTWTSGMGGDVKIELYKAGALNRIIAASTANDGAFNFTLPASVTAASDYKIKVSSVAVPSTSDISTINFSVVAPSSNILIANLDTDPGFTTTGLFEYGAPVSPNKVLTSHTGSATNNIYDTDLDATCLTASTLTTQALNCANHTGITLDFWYHAYTTSTFKFEISTNNSTWTELFSKTGSTTNSWQQKIINISAIADGQPTVYIRWSLVQGSSYYGGDGLAIDDISITGTFSPATYAYDVTFNGNGNTGGNVPVNQIKQQGVNMAVTGNTGSLTKTNYNFVGWNTATNGLGTNYSAGGIYTADSAITLYAKWAPNFASWSGGPAFNVDSNGDGIANGIAWVLGAANTSASATALLPVLDNATDPTYFIYTYRRNDSANVDANTTIAVEYGSTLSSWTTASHDASNIIITETNDSYGVGVDKVEVKIKRTLAVGQKLFTRLKVVITP